MLCINDAISRVSGGFRARVPVFSLDPQWVLRHHVFLSSYKGEKYVALPLESFPACGGIPGAIYLRWGHHQGLSDDPHIINTGCHSGYGALGLAYHKQARRVFLIGYDLNPGGHGLYASQYEFWARNYRDTVPQLKARGIEVYNCNSGSAIDAFPYADPDSVLRPFGAAGGS